MANLRRTFHGILRDYGHNVLLQRRLPDVFDSPHPVPQFENKFEKLTTRYMYPRSAGLALTAEEQEEGVIRNADIVYYFEYMVEPHEGDRIYELGLDFKTTKSTWIIDMAWAYRGKGGRVEYWACGCSRETPD